MIARVVITAAALSALACHSLALAFEAGRDDQDENDEVLWRALNEGATELVFDPRDADRVWRALVDLSNGLGDDLHYGTSTDRRADAGAMRALSGLSSRVLAAGRAVAS